VPADSEPGAVDLAGDQRQSDADSDTRRVVIGPDGISLTGGIPELIATLNEQTRRRS
jgi:hypothetical protein